MNRNGLIAENRQAVDMSVCRDFNRHPQNRDGGTFRKKNKISSQVSIGEILIMSARKPLAVLLLMLPVLFPYAAAAQETHFINAQARIFAPEVLHINPGDAVQWQNMTSHNTVSVEGLVPDGAEHWRSQLGENLGVTLTVEGVYAYVCEPHIGFGMVGVIVVGKPVNIDAAMTFAQEKLQGPYRRLIGKLLKVQKEAQ